MGTVVSSAPAVAAAQNADDINARINNALQTAKGLSGVNDVRVDIPATAKPGTYDCGGHNARISGGQNHVTLKHCKTVAIMGGQNVVRVVDPSALRIYGSDNSVTWSGATTPSVDNRGSGNTIVKQ